MDLKEVGDKFLDFFRQQGCKTGDILIPQMVRRFYGDLNPAEQSMFDSAVNNLGECGFIACVEREHLPESCYELTEKGYRYIYNCQHKETDR